MRAAQDLRLAIGEQSFSISLTHKATRILPEML
jgi:hypothetical protein